MPPLRALFAIHLAAFLLGLVGLFGALSEATPLLITFGRALFAFICLWLFSHFRGKPSTALSKRQHGFLLLCGLLLALHWALFFYAVSIGGVAIAGLGFAAFPAFALLLESLLLRRRPGPLQWLALLLVSVGMLLVAPDFSLTNSSNIGLFWAALSALLFAVLSLLMRFNLEQIEPYRTTLSMTLVTWLCLLPFAAPLLPTLKAMNWLWLAVLGLLCTAFAHSLIASSLKRISASSVSVILALEAVYAIAAAWIFLHEQPSLSMLAGGSLIISASVLISRAGGTQKRRNS
ncbi:hypothetical protein AXE65_03610 [Ventosimonas gracilis]|uniref:EamA domain-containing protein n=1 Tax=Ventosimonas gracilis TaxID=1680762 RepID=A0A139SRZ0_9GAMM|nr:DMT family transporter [Ventosimonas gracilis]KXU37292.1 hypothetical protein AXE65_03610 [Ventosimonas gracilis]